MAYGDNAGNVFLGDAIYSQGIQELITGVSFPNLNTELLDFLNTAPLKFRQLASQANFDNFNSSMHKLLLFYFAPQADSIDDRYSFSVSWYLNAGQNAPVIMFDSLGGTLTTNLSTNLGNASNSLLSLGATTNTNLSLSNANQILITPTLFVNHLNPFTYTGIIKNKFQFCGVADDSSLAMFLIQFRESDKRYCSSFYYAGRLADVNPNYSYYNQSVETDTILGHYVTDNANNDDADVGYYLPSKFPKITFAHRINATAKETLITGDAIYPIVCSDGQTPTTQWATDFYVFDNNATLGYPAIGRVRNLLLAQGIYTIGKPVKIQGTAMPDNGFNCWLPVGTFGGKVVLMRCYSSASL